MAKTFFKWPGSKSWLIRLLSDTLPCMPFRVVEPFAGSAAFFLGSHYEAAYLADANKQIVDCLMAVRDQPGKVLRYLSTLENDRRLYVNIRDLVPTNAVAAAGRLIFLTNTSWGGLYRENKLGKFNVPFGNNGRSFFCEETIVSASEKLRHTEIEHLSFEQTLKHACKDDLIFVDAPYVTKATAKFFDRYHMSGFDWNDQLRLAKQLSTQKMAEI